uniref:BTB domain-containing protein n=1 Tax=Chromera velia CCMP2878 TaxID=1169474 RepID=A0A0G4GL75_9ALVE|eukprot:Cvel_4860.t1-p1 / transcript=Cvel_4860.t1 / gene=Cvel_4860 / organism=Chromera_velia_CCMP2878 / gene_product=hypothetical protein / transcript_product=hypothetical protein / location=Cvel_scaffold219:57751-58494(-) / protein_length=248 / sequence_SO=supercontig / SO=protein_coding / is_pseudo=false
MCGVCVSVVLRDGEETVMCSRALLVEHSEYFKAMLESGHFREGAEAERKGVIRIREEGLRPETFRQLYSLLSQSEPVLKSTFRGLWTSFPEIGDPNSLFALLKMCDYFQMQTHVDLILQTLYNSPAQWSLDVVPFLFGLKPHAYIFESPDFPMLKVVQATLPKVKDQGATELLTRFPPQILVRLLSISDQKSRDSGAEVERLRRSAQTCKELSREKKCPKAPSGFGGGFLQLCDCCRGRRYIMAQLEG